MTTRELWTKEKTAANKGEFRGKSCFTDTFVQCGSSVVRMKFIAKTPRYRTSRNVFNILKQTDEYTF